jgi:hypothetical protein
MNDQIRNEILIKHRKETRLQSLGMIVGVLTTMFVAMTMMDMFKLVTTMHKNQVNVMKVQSAHTGIKHLEEFDSHKADDEVIFDEIYVRLRELEKFHK